MLPRILADLQNRERRGIADRLIEMPRDALDAAAEVGRGELDRVMPRADFARGFRRFRRLGIRAAEARGEGLHRPAHQLLRVGGDGAAIEPAAQQHAERHVGAQMHLERVAERGVELLDRGVR